MKITITRTGGFTGIPLKKTVDTTTLPQDEREKVEQLLSNKPINESSNKRINENQRDQFSYTISVKDGVNKQSISLPESALSEEQKALLQKLQSNK